jgi:hypothetical protein
MFILLTKRLEGMVIALGAALTLAATPFFLFNAASYFSHVSVSLAALIFAYFGARFLASAKAIDAVLMGGALGVIGLTRYYSSVLFFGSFLIFLLCTRRRKQLLVFLWIFLGAAPFLATLLFYQHAITGHALQTVLQWGHPQFHLELPNIHVMRHAAKLMIKYMIDRIYIVGGIRWKQIWPSVLLRGFPIPHTDCDLRGSPSSQQHRGTDDAKRDRDRSRH